MNLSFIRHEQSPSQHSNAGRNTAVSALTLAGLLALSACSDSNEPAPVSTGAQLDRIIATELQEGPQVREGDQMLSVGPMGDSPTVQGIIREAAKNEPNAAPPDTNAAVKAAEASAAAVMSAVEETTGHAVLSTESEIATWLDCDPGIVRLEARCVILATLAINGDSVE